MLPVPQKNYCVRYISQIFVKTQRTRCISIMHSRRNHFSQKIKVTYLTPSSLDRYRPQKNFSFLARTEVPFVKEHRSLYLHTANVLLEELITSFGEQHVPPNIDVILRDVEKLFENLTKHVAKSRIVMSRKHKMLLWIVRVRANLVVKKNSVEWPENYGSLDDLAYLESMEILISDKPVSQYSLKEFWRSLKILVEKIRIMKYHDNIRYYVECLQLCCGKFMVIASKSVSLFNYPLFCFKNEETGEYRINEAFIEETERMFHGLHTMLDVCMDVHWSEIPRFVPDKNALTEFHAIVENKAKDPFLEFIERDLRKNIYDWHVLIGERERYIQEEKFGDPSGYNVIAKWRQDHIDYCVDELKKSGIVVSMLNQSMDPPFGFDTVKCVNPDTDGLCIIVLNYIFDSIFTMTNRRFQTRYIREAHELLHEDFYDMDKFPLMVHVFHEYAVYFNGSLGARSSFPGCFIEWVRVACEESKWKGAIPGEPTTTNLVFLYERFFPARTRVLQSLEDHFRRINFAEDESDITLPGHYDEDTVMF